MDKLLLEELYYLMVLGRELEYTAKEHYMKGNISGFLHLDIGQEALSVAAMKAFQKGDVFTTYREHILALARGISAKEIMAELFGKSTGISKGHGGSMHLFDPSRCFYGGDAIVGGHLPNAVGCAYARKYQGEEHGVLAMFGDGATNGGAFFESLNIAAAQKLPLLFLCENNYYAIGTRIDRVSPFKKQLHKAKPYMPVYEVDGMDAVAVYKTVQKAQQYINEGHGPAFIEAFTCRFEGHSMSDANSYRSSQEMQICKSQDPIENMKQHLDTATRKLLEQKAKTTIEEAVEFALNSPEPDINDLKKYTFTEEFGHALS
jgi:pyruvate dehydrogenase E1 component alpha subunit